LPRAGHMGDFVNRAFIFSLAFVAVGALSAYGQQTLSGTYLPKGQGAMDRLEFNSAGTVTRHKTDCRNTSLCRCRRSQLRQLTSPYEPDTARGAPASDRTSRLGG